MFFKKKKYITINNPQKSRKNYDLTYDNVAIPEVHTHEETYDTKSRTPRLTLTTLQFLKYTLRGGSNLFPIHVSPFFCIQYIIWNYFFAKGGYYVQHIRLL